MSEHETQNQHETYSGYVEQMTPAELALIMSRVALRRDNRKINGIMAVARAQSEAALDIHDDKAYKEYSIVEDFGWFEIGLQDPSFHPVNVPDFNLFHDLVNSNKKESD